MTTADLTLDQVNDIADDELWARLENEPLDDLLEEYGVFDRPVRKHLAGQHSQETHAVKGRTSRGRIVGGKKAGIKGSKATKKKSGSKKKNGVVKFVSSYAQEHPEEVAQITQQILGALFQIGGAAIAQDKAKKKAAKEKHENLMKTDYNYATEHAWTETTSASDKVKNIVRQPKKRVNTYTRTPDQWAELKRNFPEQFGEIRKSEKSSIIQTTDEQGEQPMSDLYKELHDVAVANYKNAEIMYDQGNLDPSVLADAQEAVKTLEQYL